MLFKIKETGEIKEVTYRLYGEKEGKTMSKKTYEDGVMDCLNTINDFWHDWNEAYHEGIRRGKPGPAKEFKNKMAAAIEIYMDIDATLLEVENGPKT